MESFLSHLERAALLSEHRLENERRFADRIKTILLLDDGREFEEISEILFLDDATLRRYFKLYQDGGLEGLLELHYEGKKCQLTELQQSELISHLEKNLHTSTREVVKYTAKRYGISYSTRGMHDLLTRLGFVYKKTKALPGKSDPEKQEEFLAMYEYLMEHKSDDDPVYFIDGVHAQHNSHPSSGWILRGKEQHIATNTGRKRVNINGALNAETHEVIFRTDESINAQSTTALFAGIEQQHQDAKSIYVILDNAGYYRNRSVTYYVANSKIKLLFLPPYSPNLNLIERLWKFFKKKVASNKYYERFDDFRKATLAFFRRLPDYESELDSLLTDNFQIIRPQFCA